MSDERGTCSLRFGKDESKVFFIFLTFCSTFRIKALYAFEAGLFLIPSNLAHCKSGVLRFLAHRFLNCTHS